MCKSPERHAAGSSRLRSQRPRNSMCHVRAGTSPSPELNSVFLRRSLNSAVQHIASNYRMRLTCSSGWPHIASRGSATIELSPITFESTGYFY